MKNKLGLLVIFATIIGIAACTSLVNLGEDSLDINHDVIGDTNINGTIPPFITVINPTNGMMLGNVFQVTGSVYGEIQVSHVFVFVSPTNSNSPKTYPTALSAQGLVVFTSDVNVTYPGWYYVWAQALDADGNITNTEKVTVYVSTEFTDKTAPTISITSPANNAYRPEGTITVEGTASDVSTVAAVYIRIDNVVKTNTSSPNSWSTTFNLSEGSYKIIAWGKDGYGNVGGLTTNYLTVTNYSTELPDIAVYKAGVSIANNASLVHDFGDVPTNSSGTAVTFTISNSGASQLTLGDVVFEGSSASQFTAGSPGTTTLSSGETTTFWVNFVPNSTGSKTVYVIVSNNTSTKNPFKFTVTGTGIVGATPEIAVYLNGVEINDGTSGAHDFGSVDTGSSGTAVTVKISNAGAASLEGISVSRSGSYPDQFTTSTPGSSTLASGASTTFTLNFAPSSIGVKSASIDIANNDGNENPFNFTVSGTGTGSDTTPPEWALTYPKYSSLGNTTFNLLAKINEAGKVFYVVVADGATAPTVANITNGKASGGATPVTSGNTTVTANSEASMTVSGLSAGTAYDVYVVAQDSVPNVMASATKVDVTTSGGIAYLNISDSASDAFVKSSDGVNSVHAGLDMTNITISNTSTKLYVIVRWGDLSWWATTEINPICILIDKTNDSTGGTALADVDGFSDSFGVMQNGTFEYWLWHNPGGWSGTGGGKLAKVVSGSTGDTTIEDWSSSPTTWSVSPQSSAAAYTRVYSFNLTSLGLSAGNKIRIAVLQIKTDYYTTRNVADVVGVAQLSDPRADTAGQYSMSGVAVYTIQ